MNELESYLIELKKNETIESVVLFGSYAKGTQKDDSDIDLLVVTNETKRDVQNYKGKTFEIVWVAEDDAIKFYDSNKDNAVRFWDHARILFDKSGTAEKLKNHVAKIKGNGKQKISGTNLEQAKFDTYDSLKVFQRDHQEDPVKVSFLINQSFPRLIDLYFDIHGIWSPAPKELLRNISEIDDPFYKLIAHFYSENLSVIKQIRIFKETADYLFEA